MGVVMSVFDRAIATSAGSLNQLIERVRRVAARFLNRVQGKLRHVSESRRPVTVDGWTAVDGTSIETLNKLAEAGALKAADDLFARIDAGEDLGPTYTVDELVERLTPIRAAR